MPGRLRRQEAESSCSFKVPYSCIDLNGHMNNARYYDLAMDLMPEALRRRSPCELTSEHIGEARLGDTLSVACAASDDSFYICGEKDKPVFRMKLRFEQ
jgi:acyl-ACP thioesterase